MAYVKKTVYLEKPCAHCQKAMKGTETQLKAMTYCSTECYKAKVYTPLSTCKECGIAFRRKLGGNTTKGTNSFCSSDCYGKNLSRSGVRPVRPTLHSEHINAMKLHIKQLKKQLEKEKKRQLKDALKQCAEMEVLIRRLCVNQSCPGIATRAGHRCEACASEHNKAKRKADKVMHKAIRRARESIKAESINPIRVFDLHKWRCQACGSKTPKKLRGTYEDRAPELDHIVSLADGGTHTWANVQCLCRQCNIAKSSRSIGQLGLGFK